MDGELTQQELLEALMTCTDSAPGSDGIPYSVYKKTWSIVGPYLSELKWLNLYVEPIGCCWKSVKTTKWCSHPSSGSSFH